MNELAGSNTIMVGDASLQELVRREILGDLAASILKAFGVSVRVFAEPGGMVAEASNKADLYAYLDRFAVLRRQAQGVIRDLKQRPIVAHDVIHQRCVSGASYYLSALSYDGRVMGRIVMGPCCQGSPEEVAKGALDQLKAVEPGVEAARLGQELAALPRLEDFEARAVMEHIQTVLEAVLYSGHKALLTTTMHVATAQENYRDLERKNTELEQAYRRLQELDRLKSNFLATVSHELRTPLTSIIGYSEMLFEGFAGELTSEQRDFVGTIRGKGEQLLELIKGLLDLSKLESGTLSFSKRDVEVSTLMRDVVETLTPIARKKEVVLKLEVEAELPTLWADPARLKQVLLNLTENAIKFTPPSGWVEISAIPTLMDPRGDQAVDAGFVVLSARRAAIELRVSDTGVGIPESERERVFDAFYQVDSSTTRAQGGTGLGLSIVKRLVEAHDGTVYVEAHEPTGAVFVVTLPCRRTTIV